MCLRNYYCCCSFEPHGIPRQEIPCRPLKRLLVVREARGDMILWSKGTREQLGGLNGGVDDVVIQQWNMLSMFFSNFVQSKKY